MFNPSESRLAELGTLREIIQMFLENGRWWALPFLAVLLTTGVLLGVVQAIEYVAPFVYTIF